MQTLTQTKSLGGWRSLTLSHGVLAGPLAGGGIVLLAVCFVLVGDVRHQGVVRVGVRKQRRDGEEHLAHREGGRPLVLEDVQADATVGVDVGVVDLRDELELRRLERVVRGEVDVQEEDATRVGRVVGAHDGGLPVEGVAFRVGAGGAVGRWVFAQVHQLLLDSFESHNKLLASITDPPLLNPRQTTKSLPLPLTYLIQLNIAC